MTKQQQKKVVQYLNEAHATELALVRELQAQIAMTPKGRYREGLDKHLQETRSHSRRIEERLGELGQGSNPVQLGVGVFQAVAGQALTLAKAPLKVIRGSGGEEKVLKNAKDSCASEALEIATYTSLARLAGAVGDRKTERLARSVLEDEQRMLAQVLKEIPRLTDAMARAEFDGEGSFEVTETGAADAVREVGGKAKRTARRGAGQAKRTGRQARKVPGAVRAEGTVKGALASESDLAIPNYDSLSADDVQDKLSGHTLRPPPRRRGRRLRAEEPEPLDGHQPDRLAPSRRALDRLRRAWRGRDTRRARRGRRAASQGDTRLRAQAQGSYRRAPGNRARAHQRVRNIQPREGAARRSPPATAPGWKGTKDGHGDKVGTGGPAGLA